MGNIYWVVAGFDLSKDEFKDIAENQGKKRFTLIFAMMDMESERKVGFCNEKKSTFFECILEANPFQENKWNVM